MSTLAFQGAVLEIPDGSPVRTIDVRMPCSPAPEMRVIQLTVDAPVPVALDGLTGVNALYLEADFPVRLVVTSAAGTSQAIPAESISLVSREVAITALSLVRVAGQATTVILILGQEA